MSLRVKSAERTQKLSNDSMKKKAIKSGNSNNGFKIAQPEVDEHNLLDNTLGETF